MAVTLSDLIDAAENLWPTANAESWDAPGLVSGATQQIVSRVLLTVDVTDAVIDEAIDGAFDLVIAHHPYLMRGVSTVAENTAKGAVLAKAIRHGVSIFSAHTNADVVETGVSWALGSAFGLTNLRPLAPIQGSDTIGHGRIGDLPEAMVLGDFARLIAQVIPPTASGVRVAGEYDRVIRSVALCGGAGDSFISAAIAQGADVYVTSDLRHHVVQDAVELTAVGLEGPALIDISHWAAESLWLEQAATELTAIFEGLQVVASQLRTDPWDFVVTQ
ncbi:MAG: Nif3-like dinuclear metal center hexameric protein [Actinomycetales bacterium]|nr:Nif3-like dinuclear metal center hexameric protein [Actinomycetales bacterium]